MWSKEFVELLISKYKEHENLYNVSHPNYTDRIKRSISMFAICKYLRQINPAITEEGIKKKIHTLRSQYLKEVREANSKRRDFDGEDVYEPKLWCFSQLEFLMPYCSTRRSESLISGSSNDSFKSLPKRREVIEEKEDIAEVDCDAFEESGNDSIKSLPKRRKVIEGKEAIAEVVCDAFEESGNDSIKSLPKRRKVIKEKEDIAEVVFDAFEESGNDISVLAQGWSSQYTELSRQQKIFARKIISDVLFHGCLDNLRERTVREIHNIFEADADKSYDPLISDE